MTAEGFCVMPTAHLSYDGLHYRNSAPTQTEVEFTCRYVSPAEVHIGDTSMTYDTALAVYEFIERTGEAGPINTLSAAIQWFPDEFSSAMPSGVVEEVSTWLSYVLGLEEYLGSYDTWEG